MFQIRLPITIFKIIYGVAAATENGSWASKNTAWVAEKTAKVAENVAYYAKVGAEGIKNGTGWLEQQAREVKEQAQQVIREEEFKEINQDISQNSEKFNPQLVEKTDAEFDDWVILEKE